MSQDHSKLSWSSYYQRIRGRPPRPLLLEALERIPLPSTHQPEPLAIDLGCGDGTETQTLLQRGWRVLAIDQQAEALALLSSQVADSQRSRLQVQQARFEEVVLPRADFLYAGLSLPFCPPQHFAAVWSTIEAALAPAGWFAGHFFGERDGWAGTATMTFLTRDACRQLFDHFTLEEFREIEKDGETVQGPHHIHALEVIARRHDS